jgi:hypothetical protein
VIPGSAAVTYRRDAASAAAIESAGGAAAGAAASRRDGGATEAVDALISRSVQSKAAANRARRPPDRQDDVRATL